MTAEPIATFIHEAEAVGTRVHRTSGAGLPGVLAELLEGSGPVLAEPALAGMAEELRRHGLAVLADDARGELAAALPGAEVGLCRALAGVASSGSVVIGPGVGYEGHLSVLPPRCVVLVPAESICPDLGAALCRLASVVAAAGSRLVFVTGPSRTSDIELTPVIGVHGPVRLDVVVVDG